MRNKRGWPVFDFQPDRGKSIRADFTRTCEVMGVEVKGLASEFNAIKTAIDKEKKSYDFYQRQGKNATY